MRDNHDGLPEIIEAVERLGHGFCVVELEREGRTRRFQFGVDREGFAALNQILQLRPFDQMPGIQYRYFFLPGGAKLERNRVNMGVRVELVHIGMQIDLEAPEDLFANLKWFYELRDWNEANHLAAPDMP